MPKFILDGKEYGGSTNYASAIEYIEEDGNKTTVQDKISELNSNLTEQNENLEELSKITCLLSDSLRDKGTYTLEGNISDYKELVFVVCATNTYTNTEAKIIPVELFKTLPTDQYGWLFFISTNQCVYVKYVNDTTIEVTLTGTGFLRAIYGSK